MRLSEKTKDTIWTWIIVVSMIGFFMWMSFVSV